MQLLWLSASAPSFLPSFLCFQRPPHEVSGSYCLHPQRLVCQGRLAQQCSLTQLLSGVAAHKPVNVEATSY